MVAVMMWMEALRAWLEPVAGRSLTWAAKVGRAYILAPVQPRATLRVPL